MTERVFFDNEWHTISGEGGGIGASKVEVIAEEGDAVDPSAVYFVVEGADNLSLDDFVNVNDHSVQKILANGQEIWSPVSERVLGHSGYSVSYSDDSISWYTIEDLPHDGYPYYYSDLKYINDQFVVIGYNWDSDTAFIAFSDDGLEWSPFVEDIADGTIFPNGDRLWRIAYGDGYYVAISRKGRIFRSNNGTDWSSVISYSNVTIGSIIFGNGSFWVSGHQDGGSTGRFYRSVDGGATWTTPPSGLHPGNGYWSSSDYHDGKIYIGGVLSSNGRIASSANLTSWASGGTPSMSGMDIADMCFGGGAHYALAASTSSFSTKLFKRNMNYSLDGWSLVFSDTATQGRACVYANGFISLSILGTGSGTPNYPSDIYRSTNGVDWIGSEFTLLQNTPPIGFAKMTIGE